MVTVGVKGLISQPFISVIRIAYVKILTASPLQN